MVPLSAMFTYLDGMRDKPRYVDASVSLIRSHTYKKRASSNSWQQDGIDRYIISFVTWRQWGDIISLDQLLNPFTKGSLYALLLRNMFAMPHVQTHSQSHPSSPGGNKCTNILFLPCDAMWYDRNCGHNLQPRRGGPLNHSGENILGQNSILVVKSKYNAPGA